MACNNGRFLWDMNGIVWDRYTNGVPRQDDRLWSWILKMVMIFNGIYPLVNIQNYWTSPLLIRQSTITGPFSTGMLNYQRVYIYNIHNYYIYIYTYVCMGCKQQKWECDENPCDMPTLWFSCASLGIVSMFWYNFELSTMKWIIMIAVLNHDVVISPLFSFHANW